jgi:hypothetical protein
MSDDDLQERRRRQRELLDQRNPHGAKAQEVTDEIDAADLARQLSDEPDPIGPEEISMMLDAGITREQIERLIEHEPAVARRIQEGVRQALHGEGIALEQLEQTLELLKKVTSEDMDRAIRAVAEAEGKYPDPIQARMVGPHTHLFMVARYPTDWVLVRAYDAQHAADLANEDERRRLAADERDRPFAVQDAQQLPSPDGEPGVIE